MKGSFKKEMKNLYNEEGLTPNQLHKLTQLQKEVKENNWKIGFTYLSGSLAVGIALFFLVFNTNPIDSISKEVVKNHLKGMPSEIVSSKDSDINEALDKLDFKVVTAEVTRRGYQVIGARYCSVQGKIAAQIRLKKNGSDKVYTLYQYLPEDQGVINSNLTRVVSGVDVQLWASGKLVNVLAGPQN